MVNICVCIFMCICRVCVIPSLCLCLRFWVEMVKTETITSMFMYFLTAAFYADRGGLSFWPTLEESVTLQGDKGN